MSEQTVGFHCGENRVYGILHRPDTVDESACHRGIVFLNAGSRYRAGPYRLYTQLARKLVRAGITVLRFDLPGIGDSEGTLFDSTDYQRKFIEHNDSSMAAITFMQEEVGVTDVGVAGLCGGAFAALRAGAADPRISSLVLLSLPVEELGDLSEEAVQHVMLRQYLRKIFQWKSWSNLLLLRSDFRFMAKAISRIGHIHKQISLVDESLWKDFRRFTESRPILLMYGTTDPLYASFKKAYPPRIAKLSRQQQSRIETLVVENGNHTFSGRDWQQQAADTSISWWDRIGEND